MLYSLIFHWEEGFFLTYNVDDIDVSCCLLLFFSDSDITRGVTIFHLPVKKSMHVITEIMKHVGMIYPLHFAQFKVQRTEWVQFPRNTDAFTTIGRQDKDN